VNCLKYYLLSRLESRVIGYPGYSFMLQLQNESSSIEKPPGNRGNSF